MFIFVLFSIGTTPVAVAQNAPAGIMTLSPGSMKLGMNTLARSMTLLSTITAVCTCCGAALPTAPTLTITLSTTALKAGEEWRFSTINAVGAVGWSSDNPRVCSITQSGIATAVGIGTTTITASDQRSVATLSLSVVPAVDGRWVGHVERISYKRISGSGPMPPAIGGVGSYELYIQQDHAKVVAHDSRYANPEVMTGTVNTAGVISLKGEGVAVLPEYQLTEETTSWIATLQAGEMTGEWTLIIRFTAIFGPQVMEARGRIFDLRRQDAATTDAQ